MSELLQALNERIKALGADWAKYTVVGSFLLYVAGYLVLRFHLTALGVGTDLTVLDERYLFAGARFLVFLVAAVPKLVLLALLPALLVWMFHRLVPPAVRARAGAWLSRPGWLAGFGIVFAVATIQLVMVQCFLFSDLLLAQRLPDDSSWLIALLLGADGNMSLYFAALVAACALTLAVLYALRGKAVPAFARGLLAFLAAVQLLLLPINFGVLIVDKSLARLARLGDQPLADGQQAWLVWEGKDGVTYLVRQGQRRSLLTLRRDDVKRTEIVGFDKILPLLYGPTGSAR